MAGDTSNIVWPLHRILAGFDSMGLDDVTVQRLQKKFGWTLSFSRAMHCGPTALRQWFLRAGVDPWELEWYYQCSSQEAVASCMTGARVQKTPFPGVQRVMCSYIVDGKRVEVASSLLMHAPLSQTSSGKSKASSGVAGEEVSRFEADIPGVMPQLHGNREPKPTGSTAPVHSVPLVLTPPRIALLTQMARGLAASSNGMQLTGVHGAGKSVLLHALSTVLPLGHPCDMLFLSDASKLLSSATACGEQLAQSSGALVDSRAMGIEIENAVIESKQRKPYKPATALGANQLRAAELWDFSGDRGSSLSRVQLATLHKESGPAMENVLLATLTRIKAEAVNVRCGRVYIFDEVDKLMKGLREHANLKPDDPADRATRAAQAPQFRAIVDFLPWYTALPYFCFRVLASSPDCVRESMTEAESVFNGPFYELRPPRFEHLAAILHTAPHFIFPNVRKLRVKKGEHFMSLHRAMRVCKVLCGNMRRVTSYVAGEYELRTQQFATVAVSGGTRTVHNADELLEVFTRDYVDTLANRMVKLCKNPDALDRQHPWEDGCPMPRYHSNILSATFYDVAALGASMSVRQQPHDKQGRYDLLGATTLNALSAALRNKAIMMDDPEQLRLFARLVMTKSKHFSASKKAMEDEVHKRLSMQCLASRKWKLSALAGFDGAAPVLEWPMHKLMRAAVDSASADVVSKDEHMALSHAKCDTGGMWLPASDFPWGASDTPMVDDLLQCSGNERFLIDADTVRRGRSCLQDGGTVLISTAGRSPHISFVLLQSSGMRRSITFVEVTRHTLSEHATGDGYGTLPTSLKDLARLTEAEHLTAEHEDGAWRVAGNLAFTKTLPLEREKPTEGTEPSALQAMRGPGWTPRGPETLVNFWLRVLSCPKRIVACVGGATPHNTLHISVDDAAPTPEAACSAADVECDISIVYVSGSGVQPAYKEYAALECDFAYGVFQADLDDALEEWLHMPQGTA